MKLDRNTEMQPWAAGLSMNEEIELVESALANVSRPVVLVEDAYARICWQGEKLISQRRSDGRSWKISSKRLVRVAPARRVLEELAGAA